MFLFSILTLPLLELVAQECDHIIMFARKRREASHNIHTLHTKIRSRPGNRWGQGATPWRHSVFVPSNTRHSSNHVSMLGECLLVNVISCSLELMLRKIGRRDLHPPLVPPLLGACIVFYLRSIKEWLSLSNDNIS